MPNYKDIVDSLAFKKSDLEAFVVEQEQKISDLKAKLDRAKSEKENAQRLLGMIG